MPDKERKVTLPWEGLAEILRKSNNMFGEEEIREITLVKPKQVLLYIRRKTRGKKGEADASQSVS